MTTTSPRPAFRRRLARVAAALLLTAITGCAGGTTDPATQSGTGTSPMPTTSGGPSAANSDPAPAGRAPLPPNSSPVVRVATGLASAREPLRRLAAALAPSPADSEHGGFEYVAEQQWAGVTTVSSGIGTTELRPMTHRRWRAADRSGRTQTREYPPGTDVITASTRSVRAEVSTYGPGELSGPAALGTDRAAVNAAITDRVQPENGVMDFVRAVDEIYRERAPRLATRAAILEVLADADLDWTGPSTDSLGRACLIVSVDTRGGSGPGVSRDLLHLDPPPARSPATSCCC